MTESSQDEAPGQSRSGRSHGEDNLVVADTLGMTSGEEDTIEVDPDGADEPMSPSNAGGTGGQGAAAARSIQGGPR